MRPRTSEQSLQIKPRPHPLDEWERGWLEHWSKAGTLGYELPKNGPAGEEAAFLTEVRSPEKETGRLLRIQHEFVRGFQGLLHRRVRRLPGNLSDVQGSRFRSDYRLCQPLQVAFDPTWDSAVPYTVLLAPDGKILYKNLGTVDIIEMRRTILANLPSDNIGFNQYWQRSSTQTDSARKL